MTPIVDAAAKLAQGMQRLQTRDYEGAVTAFSKAIAAYPQFEPAYRLRSEANRFLGRGQAANADLEAVISITRARLNEAEQSLSGHGAQPNTVDSDVVPAPRAALLIGACGTARMAGARMLQSPIILWTGITSIVLVIGAVALMVLGA